jgi:hypothetical protein
MERLVIALLAGLLGFLIGLLAPGVIPGAEHIAPAEQAWLNPPPRPTNPPVPVLVSQRAVAAQTAVPPTVTPPTPTVAAPPPTPEPTPAVRTFVIRLEGGGDMTVVANDEAAARNNVKSQGGTPAN